MHSKRSARNKLYSTVSMNPSDDNVQLNTDEGASFYHTTYNLCDILIFSGPLYSDDHDDMPLDLNS